MQAWIRRTCGALAALAFLAGGSRLEAQGVTSAAVQGTVTEEAGTPIEGALVTMTNTSTGQRYEASTRNNGRFNLENVAPGGPYTIEARGIGYQAQRRSGLQLALGQRMTQDFALTKAVVQVQEVTVAATPAENPLINPSRTGAQQLISDTSISRLPLLGRNFTDLVQTVPQVAGGSSNALSVGGQNNRFNNIQIDGGVNNDLFGLGSTGAPGGQVQSKPISIEAVREYQVLVAPFDIRQGSFTGGLINAVTKSGTNRLEGSVFTYYQSQGLVGKDTAGAKASDFSIAQYGFSLGGPIVRDKLHFFVATDLQSKSTPYTGLTLGTTGTPSDSVGIGILPATATRVQEIIRDQYGFDPGGIGAPVQKNPDRNVFAKVTGQLGTNSQLELSNNYVNAYDDKLSRDPTRNTRDGYQLENSGWRQNNATNTTRLKWTALLGGRFNSEFIAGYSRIRDHRDLPNAAPLISVGADRRTSSGAPAAWIAAGADVFTPNNLLNQDIFEITENLTFDMGAHRLTVGTHNEFFKFKNNFFPNSYGIWNFADTTALKAGTASFYQISLPTAARPEGPLAKFGVQQFGFYAQDQWTPNERLTITAGVRVDDPLMDRPPVNEALLTELGINTSGSPKANLLWAPRLGFNFDPLGTGATIIRGGAGIFSGRPPYVWISNSFGNTGLEQVTLSCSGANVPVFTPNVAEQPTTCANGTGATASAAMINYFENDFKFPRSLKLALGVDQVLADGLVGTVDFLYARGLNSIYLEDVNLKAGGTNAEGRLLYGNFATTSSGFRVNPDKLSGNYRQIIRHTNVSGDYSTSITGQLQKRFSNGLEFNGGYTYSRTKDYMSLTSSQSSSNLNFAALDGSQADRNLRTSVFDVPHKVTFSGTVNLPLQTRFSLIYIGRSGAPYSYTVQSDANADGIAGNDMVYVPAGASDISLVNPADYAKLDAFIQQTPCLAQSRGRLLERNTCRNPWQNYLNARASKVFPTVNGQSLEITADLFNLLNVIDGDWGLVRQTGNGFEEQTLLNMVGYDAALNRGIYQLALPRYNQVQTNLSRWRLQLGGRYTF